MQDGPGSGTDKADGYKMPRGITAVGVFLFFGAAPWLRLLRQHWLGPVHSSIGCGFSIPQLISSSRLLPNQREFSFCYLPQCWRWQGPVDSSTASWGRLAVAVIATQVLGDLINFLRGDYLRDSVGFSVATALLFYLLRPVVRAVFNGAILP